MQKHFSQSPEQNDWQEFRPLFGGGKIKICDTLRAVTPFGGLSVFIEFLGRIGLVEQLASRAHRTAALRAELATRPDVALVAVAHKLALQLCYEAPCYRIGSCLSLASEKGGCNLEANATRIENSPAETRVAEIRKQWMELLPDDPDALWDWLLEKEQSVVLELLAFCVGQTVHAVRLAHDSRNEPRFLGRCVTRTIF